MGKFGIRASLAASMAIASLLGAGSWVGADDDHHKVKANLSGYQETPSTLSTPGTGKFTARIDTDAQTIDYKLSYEGLEAPAVAAHIHLGARSTNGGVSVFLCGGGGQSPCSPGTSSEATATGTITAANVIGPMAQGIAPGEFDELVAAIRAGVTYANIHNSVFPAGEIRGQINDRNERD